jgi:hypothetical protein
LENFVNLRKNTRQIWKKEEFLPQKGTKGIRSSILDFELKMLLAHGYWCIGVSKFSILTLVFELKTNSYSYLFKVFGVYGRDE